MAQQNVSGLTHGAVRSLINANFTELYTSGFKYFKRDYGGKLDGTDDSTALTLFKNYATALPTGQWARLESEPGTLGFAGNIFNDFYNIKKLHWRGYGTVLKNLYSGSPANSLHQTPFFNTSKQHSYDAADAGGGRYLIATTTPDSNTVTMVNSSDAVIMGNNVGRKVMIAAGQSQFYGYPANNQTFEFARILSRSGNTITLDRKLQHKYLSTLPDGRTADSADWGKARIWFVGWDVNWELDWLIEGLRVLGKNTGAPGSWEYTVLIGDRIRLINAVFPGVAPSFCNRFTCEDTIFEDQCETDKDNMHETYIRCEWMKDQRWSSASGSKYVTLIEPKINGLLQPGGTHFYARGGYALDLNDPNGQGLNRSTKLVDMHIPKWSFPWNYLQGNVGFTMDNVNIVFADGAFKVRKDAPNPYRDFNLDIGHTVNFCATIGGNTQRYSGDIGNGVVISITEDATYRIYQTTMTYASKPAWASGFIRLISWPVVEFDNCSGDREVVSASRARLRYAGHPYGFMGWTQIGRPNFNFLVRNGVLTKVVVDVTRASSISDCSVYFQNFNQVVKNTFDGTPRNFTLVINRAIKGRRVIDLTGWTNKQTGDSLETNNVADASALDGTRYFNDQLFVGSLGATGSEYTYGEFDCEFHFDIGNIADPQLFDAAGAMRTYP